MSHFISGLVFVNLVLRYGSCFVISVDFLLLDLIVD